MMIVILGVLIALSLAYYLRQRQRQALEDRQERLQRRQEQLLQQLRLRKELEERRAKEDEKPSGDQPS